MVSIPSRGLVRTDREARRATAPNTERPGAAWAAPGLLFFAVFALAPMAGVIYLSLTSWEIFFVPLLLSTAATAVMWRQLLDPNFGIPSKLSGLLGTTDLLGTKTGALACLIAVTSWQFIPFHALLYQGAARTIPQSLYEAAVIDGAGRVRQFFHVALPHLRNTAVTPTTFTVVGGLTAFDIVLLITNGGPGTDTSILPFQMYQTALRTAAFSMPVSILVISGGMRDISPELYEAMALEGARPLPTPAPVTRNISSKAGSPVATARIGTAARQNRFGSIAAISSTVGISTAQTAVPCRWCARALNVPRIGVHTLATTTPRPPRPTDRCLRSAAADPSQGAARTAPWSLPDAA